jgi:hypothetical protein
MFDNSEYGLPEQDEATPLMLNQKTTNHVKWETLECVMCEKSYKNLTNFKRHATINSDQNRILVINALKRFHRNTV